MSVKMPDTGNMQSTAKDLVKANEAKQAEIKRLEAEVRKDAQEAQSTTDKALKDKLEAEIAKDSAQLKEYGVPIMYSEPVLGVKGGVFVGDDEILQFEKDVQAAHNKTNADGSTEADSELQKLEANVEGALSPEAAKQARIDDLETYIKGEIAKRDATTDPVAKHEHFLNISKASTELSKLRQGQIATLTNKAELAQLHQDQLASYSDTAGKDQAGEAADSKQLAEAGKTTQDLMGVAEKSLKDGAKRLAELGEAQSK